MLQKIKNYFTQKKKESKLGLIMGVLIPTLLNIYGVVLFLRVGVIRKIYFLILKVGQAGLWLTVFMYVLGYTIVTITTLSLSAICIFYFQTKVQMEK
jgi:hypothetical protein